MNTPALFPVFYMTFSLLLLTLSPFDLQEPAGTFIWHFFSKFDFALNILLFLPLGAAMQQSQRFSHGQVLFYAAIVSSLAEVTQLYIPDRYSGLMDIISNMMGASLGFMLWRTVAHYRLKANLVLLIILLLPLGWVGAMRANSSSLWAGVMSIELFVAALLFNQARQAFQKPKPIKNVNEQSIYAFLTHYFATYYPFLLWNTWLVAMLSGLSVTSPKALVILFLCGCALPWLLQRMTVSAQWLSDLAIALLLIFVPIYNLFWFAGIQSYTWGAFRYMHWIEILLLSVWWVYYHWILSKKPNF